MNLLAVDTATEICGVALAVDGQVSAQLTLNFGQTHTRSIMGAIDALLSVSRLQIADIDLFVVTRGPGSFTGLRIGISTVKGLAVATGKPMVGISSLDVIAHQAAGGTQLVCPLMDARRKEVYWSLFRRHGENLVRQGNERVGSAEDIAMHIDDTCFFIGNGVPNYRHVLESSLQQAVVFAGQDDNAIRPGGLARLGWQRYQAGRFDDVEAFTPVYLRKSDAERNKMGKS